MDSLLPVNSFTQWGNLRQIMVGNADNACFQPKTQPCQKPTINDPYLAENILWPEGRKTQKSILAANNQLDNLSNILTKEGVKVVRPKVMDWSTPLKSPWWEVPTQYCGTCPRDLVITFGNIVMEAPTSRRDRYFEIFAYRPVIEQLWKTDRNMLWHCAPKTSMADSMFDCTFVDQDDEERAKRQGNTSFCLKPEGEVTFDAADFTRTGKHVFGQISMTTNIQGVKYLSRDLQPHGFQVHPIRFHYDLTPSHIDATFVVLKPGLVLTNPARKIWEEDKQIWAENDWDFIEAPWPINANRPAFSQSSYWLSMNILVVNENLVIAEQEETSTHAVLEDHGFEVIKVPFRDVFEFGGAIHCSTWDITRDDSQVDLFKKWLPENEAYVAGDDISKPTESILPEYSWHEEWPLAEAEISENSARILNYPVQENWQNGFLENLVDVCGNNGQNVLQIGVGMGTLAEKIGSNKPNSHVIVELNKSLAEHFKGKLVNEKTEIKNENWEKTVENIPNASLDAAIYNANAMSKSERHLHQFNFIGLVREKLKIGGSVTYANLVSYGSLYPVYYTKELGNAGKIWAAIWRTTQLGHLLASGWSEDEISYKLFTLSKEDVEKKGNCSYYGMDTCLVPVLTRKR